MPQFIFAYEPISQCRNHCEIYYHFQRFIQVLPTILTARSEHTVPMLTERREALFASL